MQPAARWRPQLTMGSAEEMAATQRPIVLPRDLHTEWDLVIRAQHNLLLVGTPPDIHEMLVAMKPHLREPLQEHRPATGAAMPQPPEGTLILLEVARLDAEQQTQLLQWLDQFNERLPVRVVSTTSEPLFPLVQTGAFLADLYYKLNIVLIDLVSPGERTSKACASERRPEAGQSQHSPPFVRERIGAAPAAPKDPPPIE